MCAAIRGGLWLAVTICRIFFFMQVLAGKVFVTFEAVSALIGRNRKGGQMSGADSKKSGSTFLQFKSTSVIS